MRAAAIVAAAGSGRRMGVRTPKQFLKLGGEPILIHTLKTLAALREIEKIVVALPERRINFLAPFVGRYGWDGLVEVVAGGAHRQDSVAKGLELLDDSPDLVLVHDAVRPFADSRLIRRVLRQAERCGAAVPVIPLTDTLKRALDNERVVLTMPRDEFFSAQTPQGFKLSILREAFQAARRDRIYGTDESSLVERLGYRVALVRGSELNIKITRPVDLLLAESILKRLKPRKTEG